MHLAPVVGVVATQPDSKPDSKDERLQWTRRWRCRVTLAISSTGPKHGRDASEMQSAMTFIDRLLIREEIDALELDLAAARGADPGRAPAIEAQIIRLETKLRRATGAAVKSETCQTA
ncbi:MAG: hypothetical protein JNJ73_13625 [Hyphomonadaceae bacterium]|nr:hypothetical protein [Hyphomonadaceae bacterium]